MSLGPEAAVQILIGLVLGIIGWNVRLILARVEQLQRLSNLNRERLIRMETQLGMAMPRDYENREYDS